MDAAAAAGSRRRVAVQVFAMCLATKVAFVCLTWVALMIDPRWHPAPVLKTALAAWQKWDVGWYLTVSRVGYSSEPLTGYFPLYPSLIHAVSSLLGDANASVTAFDPLRLSVALVISNLFSIGAFVGVGLLALNELRNEAAAYRAVLLQAAYPFAFFYFAPYSESALVALAAFSIYFARRGRWWPVVPLAFLAAFTRPTAGALVVPLAWEYARQHGWWRWETWRRLGAPHLQDFATPAKGVMVIAALPLGLAAYFAYLGLHFGDPFLVLGSRGVPQWHPHLTPFWITYAQQFATIVQKNSSDRGMALVDFSAIVMVVLITLLGIRRQAVSLTLFCFAVVWISTAFPRTDIVDRLAGSSRYMLEAFPVFLVLSAWVEGRPWLGTLLVSLGFMVEGAMCVAFLWGRFTGF